MTFGNKIYTMHIISINGTADRFEWWVTTLISDVVAQLTAIIGVFYWSSGKSYGELAGGGLIALAGLSLWISIAVTFRRLRDRGRPLWTFALGLTPVVGWLWLLVECGFLPSAYRGAKRTLTIRTVKAEQAAHGDAEPAP